jgi:hypothetical protein
MTVKSWRNCLFALFVVLALLTGATGSGVLRAAMMYGEGWIVWYDEPGGCNPFYYMCMDYCVFLGGLRYFHCEPYGDLCRGTCWCQTAR